MIDVRDWNPFAIAYPEGKVIKIEYGNMELGDLVILDFLVNLFRRDGMVIYEIGSWTGSSTCCLGKCAKENNGKLFCIDNFKGSPGSYQTDFAPYAKERLFYNLKRFNLNGEVTLLEGNSDDFYKDVPDESIDFLFLDADHRYSQVKKDLDNWLPKIRPGGMFTGHDFNSQEYLDEHAEKDSVDNIHHGVAKAVMEKFDRNIYASYLYDKHTSIWGVKKNAI